MGKRTGKAVFGRTRYIEGDIKITLGEIVYMGVDWIELVHDHIQ
jgi:hypothetical protein